MAPPTISNTLAGQNGGPNPQDLVLPDVRQKPLPRYAQYTLPEEFVDPVTHSPINLDETKKVTGIFDSFSSFLKTTLSVGGLVNKPRNVVNAAMHPYDYATGKIETGIADRAQVPAYHMPDYAPMDEDWRFSQLAAGALAMVFSVTLDAWSGGKNTDGSGRTHYLVSDPDPFTGKRSMGSLPLGLVMSSIFITGGSLTSQHRWLQADGMSSKEAYLTALNPLTGWPLTLYDEDHAAFDYVHADLVSGSVAMVYDQYTRRLGGIAGVLIYSGLLGSGHLVPALETSLALLRGISVGTTMVPPAYQGLLTILPDSVSFSGANPAQQKVAAQLLTYEKTKFEATIIKLTAERDVLSSQLILTPTDAKVIKQLDAIKLELAAAEKYIEELDRLSAKLANGRTIRFARGALNGPQISPVQQRWLDSFSETVPYDGNVADQQAAGLQRLAQEKTIIQTRLTRLTIDQTTLNAQRGLRPSDSGVVAKIGEVTGEIQALENYGAHLDSLKDTLDQKGIITFTREVTKADVQALAATPFTSGTLPKHGTLSGDAIDLLEHARNYRAELSNGQRAFIAKYPSKWMAPVRFAYGATTGFTDGKWKIRAGSYLGGVLTQYLISATMYKMQWEKSWKESFISASSMFVTLGMNEPWIGALKASGVKKIPVVLQMLPSASTVNLWWSVKKWDRDIMLVRCREERANLLHSQDPEYRARIRQRIARVYELANPDEKADWAKPISDDGCGMPIPR